MSIRAPEIVLREAIADCVDRRRLALTEIRRVVMAHRGTGLFQRACTMAVPLFYAHWEGFAKEVLELYVEFLGGARLQQSEAHPAVLAYAWSGQFKKLAHTLTHEKKRELIELFLASQTEPLAFSRAEAEVSTKSNLTFEVLQEVSSWLRLDVGPMTASQRKLNALVNQRNQIAHGGREPTIHEVQITEWEELVVELITALEDVLNAAVSTRSFARARPP